MLHSVKEKLTEAKDRASEKFQEVKNKSKEKSLKTFQCGQDFNVLQNLVHIPMGYEDPVSELSFMEI
jgi:hypothetical protein